MSWLKENYEKAALGGAAVIALGVGALIFAGDAGRVEQEQNPKQENTFTAPGSERLGKYSSALTKTSSVEFQQHLESDLNSFIAFPLYGVKGTEGLTELNGETLFHGIELKWWKKYGLEDYKFSGGDEKDSDQDGFTHKEEAENNTNPVDADSHPDLIVKLKLTGSKAYHYRIQWTRVDPDRVNMTFTYGRSKTSFDIVKVGDTFPKKEQKEEYLNRFKFKGQGSEKNPTTNFNDEYVEVEDLLKKATYKVFKSDGAKKFIDWKATLKLATPNGGNEFTVPEGGEFSLPYKEGGKGYKFKLDDKRGVKLKKLNSVDIEYKSGDAMKTYTLEFGEGGRKAPAAPAAEPDKAPDGSLNDGNL